MNNQLFDNATGFNRVVDSVKIVAGETSGIPLAQVLLISRVLFAIVMIGFIGYFFDRIKLSLLSVGSKAKADSPQGR